MRQLCIIALIIVAFLPSPHAASKPAAANPECTTASCCLNGGPGSELCCTPGHFCPIR